MAKIFFILLFFAIAAYGQQQERVAIIQTLDNNDSIGFNDLSYLTDRLRETAVNVLPESHYLIMTTESIVAFLGSQERAAKVCREASCLAELGRKVSADYVAQARIGRFNKNLTIKTELYSVKKGNLINSFTGESKNLSGLLAIINEKAPILFKKLDKRLYSVKLSTEPSGANLSFDGDSQSSCTTPCKVELPAGNVRITGDLEEYETTDTTISIKQNNQSILIRMKPNFGFLEVKPAYSGDIGKDEQWNLTLNGQSFYSLENKLPADKYKGELSHRCYEDISFNIGVGKGKRQVFDMAKQVKLKKGGLVLKAEKSGEPVFVNGKQVGKTPFSGSVPLCAVVEIGKSKEKVDVELEHNGRVEYTVEGNSDVGDGYFTDKRDGKEYRIVKIGKQTWMAENLNYNVKGGKCYGEGHPFVYDFNSKKYVTLSNAEIQTNCNKYGRLYSWNTAMKACPRSWHLPSNAEWDALYRYVDGTIGTSSPYQSFTAGKFLKATSGWIWDNYNGKSGNGTDAYGFSALPGGSFIHIHISKDPFAFEGTEGSWWCSSSSSCSRFIMNSGEFAGYSVTGGKFNDLLSVRCIKD